MADDASPDPTSKRTRSRLVARKLGLTGLIVVFALALGALVAPFAASTRTVNTFVDHRALAAMAAVALRRPKEGATKPLPYTNAAELERITRPRGSELVVDRQPMRRFRMDDSGLTQEVITFPSAISLDHPESNTARAYVYRHGRLGERPVVIWVPGQYVFNLVLVPISWFTHEIVTRGADVVLMVPPYHLDRTPSGFASGDAVFATSFADHLGVYAQELSDLRRIIAWLRGQGVRTVGGFGASAGGMLLLRIATWERSLDFLTVFIPLIRLGAVLDAPDTEPMRQRVREEGRSLDEVKRIYAALDPSLAGPQISPERISVLYGRFDPVAPAAITEEWARSWGVTRLLAYDRGHTLAFFTRQMYRDYARLLDEDLRAFDR